MMNKYEWLVAVYANAQNDLGPVMADLPEKMAQFGVPPQGVVGLQLGTTAAGEPEGMLAGRYAVTGGQCRCLGAFNDLVMARPQALLDFLGWVLRAFPARKKILVLSGHGLAWLGMLPSITPTRRLMMPLAGLGRAVREGLQATGTLLDGILFDTCYMNTIEGLFELRHYCPPAINVVVSYGETPRSGLDYGRLFRCLAANHHFSAGDLFRKVERNLNRGINPGQYGYWYLRLRLGVLARLKRIVQEFAARPQGNGLPRKLIIEDMLRFYPFKELGKRDFRQTLLNRSAPEEFIYWMERAGRRLAGSQSGNPGAFLTLNAPDNPELARCYQKYYTSLCFARRNLWVELQQMERGQAIQNTAGGEALPLPERISPAAG